MEKEDFRKRRWDDEEKWHHNFIYNQFIIFKLFKFFLRINILPNDKILDGSKLKAFVDDKSVLLKPLKLCFIG